MPTYSGRLELTWTNKEKTLLAHEDGRYEWVDPADYRVAEVRLLHDVASIGDVRTDNRRAADNLLIRGDALHALNTLNRVPEFSKEYVGKVRLVYLDAPFNTGQAFEQYDDNLEHSVWLTMLRDRLAHIKPLLAPTGSVWVHLDDTEIHRARCVLDEVMGALNHVGTIIWERSHTRENRTDISVEYDSILVYVTDRSAWKAARNLLPATEEQRARYQNPDNDPRGPWSSIPAHAKAEKGRRASQYYTIMTPSGRIVNPPPGRCWLYTRERFDEMVVDGRIWFGETGDNVPRLKKFLSEGQVGLVPHAIWKHREVGTTGAAKAEIVNLFPREVPFSTPKPEALLRRIIHIATNPGDIVLDCFLGSGTTAAVAHKMGRRWVGMEWSAETVSTFALPRLRKVVAARDPGGVTEETGWTGGGGFRVFDVAPSMFDAVESRVYLAEWATNGALGEAVAAQFGYDHHDDPPFVGLKGRTRLAVVDGLVNEDVVRLLVDALGEDERLLTCGTAVDPAARQVLRDLRPGSTLKKIPAGLLDEYRVHRRERLRLASLLDRREWSEAETMRDAA